MTAATGRSIIRASFPDVDATLEHIGSGWEFDAFRSADGWVFRFPRTADAASLFEPERHVHRLVRAAVPPGIAVPVVERIGRPAAGFRYPFAAHRLIDGSPADAVSADLLPTLACDLGAALAAVHAIPEPAARDAGIGELDPDDEDRDAWIARGRQGAAALRGADPDLDRALDRLNDLVANPPPVRRPSSRDPPRPGTRA